VCQKSPSHESRSHGVTTESRAAAAAAGVMLAARRPVLTSPCCIALARAHRLAASPRLRGAADGIQVSNWGALVASCSPCVAQWWVALVSLLVQEAVWAYRCEPTSGDRRGTLSWDAALPRAAGAVEFEQPLHGPPPTPPGRMGWVGDSPLPTKSPLWRRVCVNSAGCMCAAARMRAV
jgi:hypothetical protein